MDDIFRLVLIGCCAGVLVFAAVNLLFVFRNPISDRVMLWLYRGESRGDWPPRAASQLEIDKTLPDPGDEL